MLQVRFHRTGGGGSMTALIFAAGTTRDGSKMLIQTLPRAPQPAVSLALAAAMTVMGAGPRVSIEFSNSHAAARRWPCVCTNCWLGWIAGDREGSAEQMHCCSGVSREHLWHLQDGTVGTHVAPLAIVCCMSGCTLCNTRRVLQAAVPAASTQPLGGFAASQASTVPAGTPVAHRSARPVQWSPPAVSTQGISLWAKHNVFY